MEYAEKLERERDISYGDLKKQKGRYDAACQEVENRRKKTESSFDHGKAKAQNAYQQQIVEMHNVKVGLEQLVKWALLITKNTYIISINVTNKQKERYYHEYVPDLLDVRSPGLRFAMAWAELRTEPTGPLRNPCEPTQFFVVTRHKLGEFSSL